MTEDAVPTPDQQLARLRRHGEILADFGRMAPETSDTDHMLTLACVQAARGLRIGHAKIMRHRQEIGDLLIVAGIGWRPGVVGRVSLGTDLASPPGRTLQTRQPVTQDDAPSDPEFRYAPVLREHGIVSLLNVPIVVDGAVWGVLEVDGDRARRFSTDDTLFLCALANTLGLAVHGRMGLERASEAAAHAALVLSRERTLLEELRHRSKNDLQLIVSMLIMQKRRQVDEQGRRGFDDIMDRVAAIGMAHDQLAPGQGAARVELADYLQALCGNLGKRREEVRVEARVSHARLAHERAVPLGLIVNELVTNALKYAFPDAGGGTIRVGFEATAEGEGHLGVRDDGVGMGPPRPGSSGSELVRRLVQQIGGRLEREAVERGTGFVVRFPLVT